MLIFRFLRDVPELDARAGDELCVDPNDRQFPAVLRRTFALEEIAHVIDDVTVTQHVYTSTPDVSSSGDASASPRAPRHLRLMRDGAA